MVECSECRAMNGHHPLCELASVEYKAARLAAIYQTMLKLLRQRERLQQLVNLWQGKHALLRHENNKLRRKLKERNL